MSMGISRLSITTFITSWLVIYVKALANEDTLLRAHCCRHKSFTFCPRAQHLLGTQILCPGHKKCFRFCSETFCVRNKCFPVCAAQETSWATTCPRLPGSFKKQKTCTVFPSSFSINLLAFYHECRSLIGYATHYLFKK